MERLTKRIDNYVFVSDSNAALHRLADYEDTGLTPEQILAMDEEYTNDDLSYRIPWFGIEEAIEIVKEEDGIE